MTTTARSYTVSLNDQTTRTPDPILSGRQLLELLKQRPVEAFQLFLWLADGNIEEIGLDETVNLQQHPNARLTSYQSDRLYYLMMNDRRLPWGDQQITGRQLKDLARVEPSTHSVWLDVRGGQDRLIADNEKVSLDGKGLERFFTAPITITITVNNHPVRFSQPTATGLEIKRTAIQQGVSIQLDFALFKVGTQLEPVDDRAVIEIQEGQAFRAVTTDDNS